MTATDTLIHMLPDGRNAFVGAVVPADRADSLVAEIVERAAGAPVPGTQFEPPFGRNHGPKNAWELPEWTNADHPALVWALGDLNDEQLEIIKQLVAARGEYRSTRTLLRAAGYPEAKSASGVFRSINGRCRACNRKPWWNGRPGDADGRLLAIKRDGQLELLDAALRELDR